MEFIHNTELLKWTTAIINESIQANNTFGETLSAGCSILESISTYDKAEKYTEWEVYTTLYKLFFVVKSPKDLASLVIALDSYSKLNSHVMKSLVEAGFIKFLIDMAVNTTNLNLKYQIIYLFEELTFAWSENEKWNKLIYEELEIKRAIITLLQDIFENHKSSPKLYILAISLMDGLLIEESEFLDQRVDPVLPQLPKYIDLLLETGIVELLDSLDSANNEIREKAVEVLVKHQLKELDENDDLAVDVNQRVYDESINF